MAQIARPIEGVRAGRALALVIVLAAAAAPVGAQERPAPGVRPPSEQVDYAFATQCAAKLSTYEQLLTPGDRQMPMLRAFASSFSLWAYARADEQGIERAKALADIGALEAMRIHRYSAAQAAGQGDPTLAAYRREALACIAVGSAH